MGTEARQVKRKLAKTSIYKRFTNESLSAFRPSPRDSSDLPLAVLGKLSHGGRQRRSGARSHRGGRRALSQLGRDRPAHRVLRVAPNLRLRPEPRPSRRVPRAKLFRPRGLPDGAADRARRRDLGDLHQSGPVRARPPTCVREEPRRSPNASPGRVRGETRANAAEFRAARAAGDHAAFIGIQGGNALDDGIDALDLLADGRSCE